MQYRKSCGCNGKSVRADHLNDFVFHALQQCIFSPENKEKLLHKIHEKLEIQRHIQSDEENRLMNQIHGLETAQENLTAYLETRKGSDTILNKLQQNETTLKTLRQQLDGKKAEIPTVDEDTYHRLVKQFKHYMSHVKSPEASALKAAAIQDIKIQKENITVKFCEGVPINKETEALVTGVRLQNEAFDIYELQLLGLDKNDSCSYTNSGTATISDTELQELLHTKGLLFPMQCFI